MHPPIGHSVVNALADLVAAEGVEEIACSVEDKHWIGPGRIALSDHHTVTINVNCGEAAGSGGKSRLPRWVKSVDDARASQNLDRKTHAETR
mmetsp:Transcript_51784/g.166737  ORF Transcript_51784/g.166737 Transcript_51784/m.166737 type:complete len:92 (+) Transcript_51784:788-1063(+)